MISPYVLYHNWLTKLRGCWPKEHMARVKGMAWLVVGIFLSQHVHLMKIARKIPGYAQQTSKVRRLERLLHNAKLNVRQLYRPVVTPLLHRAASHRRPLRLIIDGSQIGQSHQLLMVALATRRRAIPIMWSWRRGTSGHATLESKLELLNAVRELLPLKAAVILVGDSEFGAVKLMRKLEKWGWSYVLRQKGHHSVQIEAAGSWQRCDSVVTKGGRRRWFTRVALTQLYSHSCNFLATWCRGYQRPWLLATNLDDPAQALRAYKCRMWIEALFSDAKSNGFEVAQSRLRSSDALDRLMLGVALLMTWLLAYGSQVIKNGQRYLVDRTDRRDLSRFRIGWEWVERRLTNGDRLKITFLPYF